MVDLSFPYHHYPHPQRLFKLKPDEITLTSGVRASTQPRQSVSLRGRDSGDIEPIRVHARRPLRIRLRRPPSAAAQHRARTSVKALTRAHVLLLHRIINYIRPDAQHKIMSSKQRAILVYAGCAAVVAVLVARAVGAGVGGDSGRAFVWPQL